MDFALFVVRLVVGAYFMGHGAQKLWGVFGGHGLAGTGQFFESLGLRPGRLNAQVAGWAEFVGGLLLALGFLTPVAAVLIISVMTVAVVTIHLKNGPWATERGYELNAVYAATAFLLAASPGTWSLDDALNLGGIHGAGAAFIALAVGIWGGYAALAAGRASLLASAPATPARAPAAPSPTPAPGPATAPTAVAADRAGRISRDTDAARRALAEEDAVVQRGGRRR